MICKRILPIPELRSHIREYLLLHLAFEKTTLPPPANAYPVNPEEGIRFLVRGCLISENSELGTLEKRPTITIFGQPNSHQNLFVSHEYLMIHVRFQPGGLFKLLRIPMTEFVNQNFDAELILGHEIKEVHEQLAMSKGYENMLDILNLYFWEKISRMKNIYHPVDQIGVSILNNPQEFNLEQTANQACLSFRQFEKRFNQQIGVTPKYYARICRFYQAYVLKENQPNLDWLSVALQAGYTDYQHMVKDFKQFSGTTPNSLLLVSLNNRRGLRIDSDFRGV